MTSTRVGTDHAEVPGDEPDPKALPVTRRGRASRARLVDAARIVFERDGFVDARLGDITNEASMAVGSFYTYFDSKEEIFSAVIAEVEEQMLHPEVREVSGDEDPVAAVRAANRAYLNAYRKNVRLMTLLDQVAAVDESFREVRTRRGAAFIARNARGVERLQEQGLARGDLDPRMTAALLSGMVGRAAQIAFVQGEDWDFDELVETVTQLWVNALGMEPAAES